MNGERPGHGRARISLSVWDEMRYQRGKCPAPQDMTV